MRCRPLLCAISHWHKFSRAEFNKWFLKCDCGINIPQHSYTAKLLLEFSEVSKGARGYCNAQDLTIGCDTVQCLRSTKVV